VPTPRAGYKVAVDWERVNKSLRLVMRQIEQGTLIKVPGTTSITGLWGDSGGLTYWANQEGLAGRPLRGPGSRLELAAEIGTVVHNCVEKDIRGKGFPDLSNYDDEFVSKVLSGYAAYTKFKKTTNLVPFHTELGLTSSEWLFGGTIDAVQLAGEISLIDWKTSSGIYPNHIYQLCGYSLLWNEAYPESPIKSYHLLRFSKEEGDMTHHEWNNLDLQIEGFKHLRIMYEIDIQTKARL
jgi:hypothetical protein